MAIASKAENEGRIEVAALMVGHGVVALVETFTAPTRAHKWTAPKGTFQKAETRRTASSKKVKRFRSTGRQRSQSDKRQIVWYRFWLVKMDALAVAVAALDFGTSMSGSAVGFGSGDGRSITIVSPSETYDANGDANSKGLNLQRKVPTKILIDAQSGRVAAFGDIAHSRWCSEGLNKDGVTNGRFWYLEYFKMRLNQMPLPEHLYAICGRAVPTLQVVGEVLRALSSSVMNELGRSGGGKAAVPNKEQIVWMITTPTLWSEAVKALMVHAAQAVAGLTRVHLVLESEAAAVNLANKRRAAAPPPQNISSNSSSNSWSRMNALLAEKWTTVVVVDAGGGTFDVTRHGLTEQGELKNAVWSGVPIGSRAIDDEFLALFRRIFGAAFMDQYALRCPTDFAQIMFRVEVLKHAVSSKPSAPYRIKLPASFLAATQLHQLARNEAPAKLSLNSDSHGATARQAPADPPPSSIQTQEKTDAKHADLKEANPTKAFAEPEKLDVKAESGKEDLVGGCVVRLEDAKEGGDGGDGGFVAYEAGTLVFGRTFVESIFERVLAPIVELLDLLRYDNSIIVMAGGFSESPLLIEAVQKIIHTRQMAPSISLKLQVHDKPSLAVLIGATEFGLNPSILSSRQLSRTYGYDQFLRWDSDAHREKRSAACRKADKDHPYYNADEDVCTAEHFGVICSRGESVRPEREFTITKVPISPHQEQIEVVLYATKKSYADVDPPKTTDAKLVDKLGTIVVTLSQNYPRNNPTTQASSAAAANPQPQPSQAQTATQTSSAIPQPQPSQAQIANGGETGDSGGDLKQGGQTIDAAEAKAARSSALGLYRKVSIAVRFGSQISVVATDRTSGQRFHSTIDFPQ